MALAVVVAVLSTAASLWVLLQARLAWRIEALLVAESEGRFLSMEGLGRANGLSLGLGMLVATVGLAIPVLGYLDLLPPDLWAQARVLGVAGTLVGAAAAMQYASRREILGAMRRRRRRPG